MSDAAAATAVPVAKVEEQTLLEERLEHLAHWWREPAAGVLAVAISTFDAWTYDRDAGLSSSLDEILLLTGIALIAGVKNLFGGSSQVMSRYGRRNGNGSGPARP